MPAPGAGRGPRTAIPDPADRGRPRRAASAHGVGTVGEISRDVADMARTLTHFPAFYYWIVRTANDPDAYNLLIDIAWKLALVFGCALRSRMVDCPSIRRPVALLEARVPQTGTCRRSV